MEADEIRSKMVEFARSLVTLSTNTGAPDVRKRYIDLVGPGESAAMQRDMCEMSGCGLAIGGIWRAVGVKAKELEPPYKIGSAISRLITLAQSRKAWVTFAKDTYPGPGDMVLVGDGGAGGVQHVYTVVGITVGDTVEIESVDGGQRDAKRFQLISLKKRVWKGSRDHVINASDPGGNASAGRVILGWVDVSRLPFGE